MADENAISPIVRRPLYTEATDAIRSAIIKRVFRPGDALPEPHLARVLNLSRGTVRDAFRQLEQEGLVISLPHLGASVARVDARELEDAMVIRSFLETLCCPAIVTKLSDIDLADLSGLVRVMRQAEAEGDNSDLSEADLAFHHRLLGIGASPLVERLWRALTGQIRVSIAVANPQAEGVAASHEPIVQALVARDADRLQHILERHIRHGYDLLRQALAESSVDGGV